MGKKKSIDKKELSAVIIMGLFFIIIHGLAMLLTGTFKDAGMEAFEDPDNPMNIAYIFVIILVFTVVILLIAKFWKKQMIQIIILGAIGYMVFVTKMPVVRIQDLAQVMIQELAPGYGYRPEDIRIKIIGVKPGEKMYEELMNIEETRRSWELSRYFVVIPAFTVMYRKIGFEYPEIQSKQVTKAYHSGSETPLSKAQLAAFFKENSLLQKKNEVC